MNRTGAAAWDSGHAYEQEGQGKIVSCELTAPESLSLGKSMPAEVLASAVSLAPADVVTETHPPQVASVGLPLLMTELKDRATLERARVNSTGVEAILRQDIRPSIYLYTRATDAFDIRARMFAPLSGVPEDPATSSASCVVGGLLAHYSGQASGRFSCRIAQGVEMGRPSALLVRAEKADGSVQATWVGGACVLVSEGFIHVD